VPTPVAPPAPTAVATPTDLVGLWSALLEAVGRASAFTRSYLLEAHPVSFEGHVLVIGFDPEFADKMSLVDNGRNHDLLQTKLRELGHPRVQVKFIKAETPAAWAPSLVPPAPAAVAAPAAAPPTKGEKPAAAATARKPAPKATASAESKEEFKNDPLIKKALEVFKGRLLEVRA
jgi:hypothetical protein